MSGSKSRASNTQVLATVASKLAKMAAASSDDSSTPEPVKDSPDILSTSQLVSELEKQRASLLKDMSALIRESVGPLQTSVDVLRKTASPLQNPWRGTTLSA